MKSYFDCVVIGAGVAGMTSAIYLKRYNINVLLLEKNAPGGQIVGTPNIENYPGYVSIDGASLALNMFEQVKNLGIKYQYGNVIKIENKEQQKKIIYTEKEEIHTKAIIIATGRKPRKLGIERNLKKGISWCATCDGMFYKNEEVAVVGGGNSALEEALFLSTICHNVHLLYRGESLRADEFVQKKVFERNNIKVHFKTEVKELKEKDQMLNSIIVIKDEIEKELQVTGMFIYIGYEPDTNIFKDLGIQLDHDYIITNTKMETNINGIYACGDVIKKELYQLTTAVGEGSIAAYNVKEYLK